MKNFFFLAIWWAGYFFPFFSHKLSITFVLHAIFFFRQALAGNFFQNHHTPSPPQELNGPLASRMRTNTSTRFDLKFFPSIVKKIDTPKCFIVRFFTRKVSTVVFIRGG